MHKERSPRKLVRRSAFAACVVLLGGLLYAVSYLDGIAKDANCKMRLRRLWDAVTTDDTPPQLLQTAGPENRVGPGEVWHCPRCDRPYVYRPFEGPIQMDAASGDSRLRIIAWCPAPSHAGRRNVLVETGAAIPIPEDVFRELANGGFAATWRELVAMVESE